MSPKSPAEDAFVNVWIDKENKVSQEGFYESWLNHSSAKIPNPPLQGYEMLRKEYPDHSLVAFSDYRLNLLNFPATQVTPLEETPLVTNLRFLSLGNLSPVPGMLLDEVLVGNFSVTWQGYEYILYTVEYPSGFGMVQQNYVLHEGPEDNIRQLLLSAGIWADKLHSEIWVFDQGYWRKDAGLWYEVQKADWKDVILKDEFKKALQKDVYGFYTSEELYKDLGIPWKRGLIMYGPPGNGKTISLKAIMKWCDSKGHAPLYVKSFQSFAGEEYAMTLIFNKARQLAPCVIILEDLDSLINDRNRSFFLNQLDGLEGNDGLLVIGTTNHFERLDPGISGRPSRFDRKYLFDDPDRDERALYAQYWQNKLRNKNTVDFPDSLVGEIADATPKFSFAYLKEAFVSALVILAGVEEDPKPSFKSVIMEQIEKLRKQLDKSDICKRHGPQWRPLPVAAASPQTNSSSEPPKNPRQAFDCMPWRAPEVWSMARSSRTRDGGILPTSGRHFAQPPLYAARQDSPRPGSQLYMDGFGPYNESAHPARDDYRVLFDRMSLAGNQLSRKDI